MRECQLCKNCYTDDVNSCPKDGAATMHTISGEPVLEGKYHLECRLGQGGMGVVYKARHAYLKTLHAIKVILPDLVGNDPQLVTRFRQEALAAAAIRHQNVVSVSDYGVAQGVMPFLVMEYVEGESLHDLLVREKNLSPEKALEMMTAICAGVGAAHHQGIVHRDLKPLNVMILKGKKTLSESVKILDFGLAKIKSGELLGSFIQAQTTGLMGSPYYMAPEQWNDDEPDARSDVYSLGVMFFQMIAGDVPFKGNSIPAIMKKHLSDAPPVFSAFSVQVPPPFEAAVRHMLEKDPEKRTQSVDQLIDELKDAVGASAKNALTGTSVSAASPPTVSTKPAQSSMPASSVRILTNPAKSKVFIDNVSVGESRPDGWLLLEGVQSGNHHLRVKHEGFQDWEQNLNCDGSPLQVIAQLQKATTAIPKPGATMPVVNLPSEEISQKIPAQFSSTQGSPPEQTLAQGWQTGRQNAHSESEKKKSVFSPLLLAVIGISGLLLLTAIGIGGAYMLGIIGGGGIGTNKTPTPTATPPPTPRAVERAEMVKITGGKFTMGRSDGELIERPEHQVEVKDFWMDKTEVTNAEYHNFIQMSGYKNIPADWENGKPLSGKENMPVRYVNSDDAKAFAEWLSTRDGVTYRLPTEEEWEYAARNGEKSTLYPWGNEYKEECAVVGKATMQAEAVGSKQCGENEWKIQDLIGNVWEWTSSEAKPYPGSSGQAVGRPGVTYFVIRGASSYRDQNGKKSETSTFRQPAPSDAREPRIGFRLVRSD